MFKTHPDAWCKFKTSYTAKTKNKNISEKQARYFVIILIKIVAGH